jgi:hypothetical protein
MNDVWKQVGVVASERLDTGAHSRVAIRCCIVALVNEIVGGTAESRHDLRRY